MEITVVGQGSAERSPEIAELYVRVSFDGPDRDEAIRHTQAAANKATAVVLDAKDAIRQLQTDALSTSYRQPVSDDGKVMPRHWRALIEMQAEVYYASHPEALRDLVDRLGNMPGLELSGIYWRLTDETRKRVEAEVLQEAVANARERALHLAQAAGAQTVTFRQIADPGLLGDGGSDSGHRDFPMSAMMRDAAAGPRGPDIRPDDIEVRASLHVRFEA